MRIPDAGALLPVRHRKAGVATGDSRCEESSVDGTVAMVFSENVGGPNQICAH